MVRKEDRTADITWGRGMQAPQEEEDKERVFSYLKKDDRKRGRTCIKRKGEEAKSEKIVKERIEKACSNLEIEGGDGAFSNLMKSSREEQSITPCSITSGKRTAEGRACSKPQEREQRKGEHAV
jgi:hypothetical protein